MKVASFKFVPEGEKHGRYMMVTVTLKNDGKISISMPSRQRSGFSYAAHYQAKNKAQEIVAGGFIDPSIVNLVISDNALIETLRVNTVELKKAYIVKTKEFAKRYFEFLLGLKDWSEEQWLAKYGEIKKVQKYQRNEAGGLISVWVDKKVISDVGLRYRADKNTILYLDKRSFSESYKVYEAKEVRYAEQHYESSLEKLASKLNQKGVHANTPFEIKKEYIGVNLEMYIHHNGMITKAWTIIAEGPIQRPHYRYLVK